MGIRVQIAKIAVVLYVVVVAASALADTPGLPGWAVVGADIAEGWKITEVDRHQEFIRLRSIHGQDVVGAEIRYRHPEETGDNGWATEYYVVQPAPGVASSREFLDIVIARLREAEAAGAPVFVGPAPRVQSSQARPGSNWIIAQDDFDVSRIMSPVGMATLGIVLLLLALLVIPGPCRRAVRGVAAWGGALIDAIFGGLSRLLRQIDPLPDSHLPRNGGRFSPWIDIVATIVIGLLAWIFLRAVLPDGMAVQIDQSSDLVYARHFVDLHEWPGVGPMSSFGRLMQGNFIYLFWWAFLGSGIDISLSYPLVIAMNSLASALVFAGFRRIAGIFASVVAAAAFTVLNVVSSGLMFVWIPSMLPLFIVVFFITTMHLVRRPTWWAALVAGIALALTVNVHILTLLFLPVLAVACGMAGGRRSAMLASFAFSGLLETMVLLAPGSCLVNFRVLVNSGWLLPGVFGTVFVVAVGAAFHQRFSPADDAVRGVSFMYVAAIMTAAIVVGLSAVSGRHLGMRYAFPAMLGVSFVGGHVFARVVSLAFVARSWKVRWLSALAVVVLAIEGLSSVQLGQIVQNQRLRAPGMAATARLAEILVARGLTTWDIKWAVQTQEYTAFVRTIEMFPPEDPGTGSRWNGESAWQVMRMPESLAMAGLPPGFSFFTSVDGFGLMVEELRPWARRDQVEICFESIGAQSGSLVCAGPESIEPPAPGELRSVNIVVDDRVGPLQLLARRALDKFKAEPGSRVRMSYRVPLRPVEPDDEREIVLIGKNLRTFGRGVTHLSDDDWRISAVEGVFAQIGDEGQSAVIKRSGGGSTGVMVLELEMGDPNQSIQWVMIPTWFEISPSSRPVWYSQTEF